MHVQRIVGRLASAHQGTLSAGTLSGIRLDRAILGRSEEHTSELQSLMRISYAVFCLKKKKKKKKHKISVNKLDRHMTTIYKREIHISHDLVAHDEHSR